MILGNGCIKNGHRAYQHSCLGPIEGGRTCEQQRDGMCAHTAARRQPLAYNEPSVSFDACMQRGAMPAARNYNLAKPKATARLGGPFRRIHPAAEESLSRSFCCGCLMRFLGNTPAPLSGGKLGRCVYSICVRAGGGCLQSSVPSGPKVRSPSLAPTKNARPSVGFSPVSTMTDTFVPASRSCVHASQHAIVVMVIW